MSNKQESVFSGLAATLLLFTSMLTPFISAMAAIILLIVFSVYKYNQSKKQ